MSTQMIDASPTKELFIEMLTRDIGLHAAILDLIDNCVDGARRLKGSKSFSGLFVRITFSKDEFAVRDNCGGIPLEVAEKYAFRFGRPSEAPTTKHSIGRFGVGMKRAIFKLGHKFTVESRTEDDSFKVVVDVIKWSKTNEWEFQFTDRKDKQKSPPEKAGTAVIVTDLRDDARQTFSRSSFGSELADELQKRLSSALETGLTVTINGVPVDADPVKLLSTAKLAPAHLQKRYKLDGGSVDVSLFCGLGPSEEVTAAGWHVYCNGRLILSGDKTETTGWGAADSGLSIPGFHGQFNLIRGYAFFDSDDAALLPWNTTKTGINEDSGVYRAVRLEMMRLMRPVVDFCNKLKEEKERTKDSGDDAGPLQMLLDKSTVEVLDDIKSRDAFVMPKVVPPPAVYGPPVQRIQYDRLLSQVNEVRKAIKARSLKDLGEKTFDYYYNAEIKK